MQKKTFLLIVGLVLALMTVLCACGSQQTPATTAATQPQAPTETTTEVTTVPTEPHEKDLIYFNIDKLLVKDLKREKDRISGLYTVRFLVDGRYEEFQIVRDDVAQRVDNFYGCVLEYDKDGYLKKVKTAQSELGGTFYDMIPVTAIDGNTVTSQSTVSQLTLADNVAIYDLTGREVEIGAPGTIQVGDKISAYTDPEGLTKVVYIVSRNFVHDDAHKCEHCGEDPQWVAWDGTVPLTTGHYVMTQDVHTEETITLAGEDVALCLNGYSLTGTNRVFILTEEAQLTVYDHQGVGDMGQGVISGCGIPMEGTEDMDRLGGTIYAEAGTVLNQYGGEIRSGLTEDGSRKIYCGGTIYTEGAYNIYGGIMTGGIATYRGGGVYVGPEGSFNMTGGLIRYGNAGNSGGTACFSKDSASAKIVGGKVIAGIAVNFGGGIYTEKSMKVTGGEFTGDLVTGVNAEYGGVFGAGGGIEVEFTEGVVFYGGSAREGGNVACRNKCNMIVREGVVIRDGYAEAHGGNVANFGIFELRGGVIQDGYAATSGGNIYSFSNGTTHVEIYSGSVINGSANIGGNIRMAGNVEKYEEGSILKVYGGVISGGNARTGDGGNVYLSAHSQMYMIGGQITGGTAAKNGGGVTTLYTEDTQSMTRVQLGGSAVISGNTGTDLYLNAQTYLELAADEPLTDAADIRVCAADPYAPLVEGAYEGAEKAFTWRGEVAMQIIWQDDKLIAQ